MTAENRAVDVQERLEGGQGRLIGDREGCTRGGRVDYSLHTAMRYYSMATLH